MNHALLASLVLPWLMAAPMVQAAVAVGATRVIYNAAHKEASLGVSNKGEGLPYLIQSRVLPYASDQQNDHPDFIVTPPLFRLDPNSEGVLRIIATPQSLSDTEETLLRLEVKAIPALPEQADNPNMLQIAIKTSLKLFYRPAALQGDLPGAVQALRWRSENGRLSVFNPTGFHVVVDRLTLNGQAVTTDAPVLAPHRSTALSVATRAGARLHMDYINDYGGVAGTAYTVE
ncbi:molecular chaperone [Pseudomonas sp. S75]|uniref:fimbrial biogenesis chaperone n=1 Tax=unclassified Pseudomonas TaxID=196821 RepID=UPI0019084E0E|nr:MULTISPECIES: molecular chaperone [unclassified Pseudomonas]MBJ9976667.1 molecular chaperone [Pseudomonas sp. S30]MBK0153669.1 molecular chaperone [Pseudomonas sp. S75]